MYMRSTVYTRPNLPIIVKQTTMVYDLYSLMCHHSKKKRL